MNATGRFVMPTHSFGSSYRFLVCKSIQAERLWARTQTMQGAILVYRRNDTPKYWRLPNYGTPSSIVKSTLATGLGCMGTPKIVNLNPEPKLLARGTVKVQVGEHATPHAAHAHADMYMLHIHMHTVVPKHTCCVSSCPMVYSQ